MFLLSCFKANSSYTPWFTGPLLSPTSHSYAKGQKGIEVYSNYTRDNAYLLIPRHHHLSALLSYGISDNVTIQYTGGYSRNKDLGFSGSGLTDPRINLGFQLFNQDSEHWRPGLYISFYEIIPVGKYNNLNPFRALTDANGSGAYQTGVNANFQYLLELSDAHYLRTRVNVEATYLAKTDLSGFSAYGGGFNTFGRIKPGNIAFIDIAQEFTINQNWVAVMEYQGWRQQKSTFKGNAGESLRGTPARVGQPKQSFNSLAPAIEYNYNQYIGVIAGVWFTLNTKNTESFRTVMFALNMAW